MTDAEPTAATITTWIAADLASARAQRNELNALLEAAPASNPNHPSHAAYAFGGLVIPFGFGAVHILGLIGLLHARAGRVATLCADVERPELLVPICLHALCEQDPAFESDGFDICRDQGLLKRGRVDGFWLKRPKLGLGQAARLLGFQAAHAQAMRGVFTWSGATIGALLARSAHAYLDAPFGAALIHLAATDDGRLGRRGAMALHEAARDRYFARRAGFEAYSAATADTGWREKPPRSRQGHLAVTTARAKGMALPAVRRRGAAADWLERNGANVRFIEEDR